MRRKRERGRKKEREREREREKNHEGYSHQRHAIPLSPKSYTGKTNPKTNQSTKRK
jgi:hypothetical protein